MSAFFSLVVTENEISISTGIFFSGMLIIYGFFQTIWLALLEFKDFPGGPDSKASTYNVGDPGSIPG